MGWTDILKRINRIGKAQANSALNELENIEVLEEAIREFGEKITKNRMSVAKAIAGTQKTESRYKEQYNQFETWGKRAKLAYQAGNKEAAVQALKEQKNYESTVKTLEMQLKAQQSQVQTLKKALSTYEDQLQELNTKKEQLRIRYETARTSKDINESMSDLDPSSILNTFDRIEGSVLEMEAESSLLIEAADDGATYFEEMEAELETDDSLAALEAEIKQEEKQKALEQVQAVFGSLPPASNSEPIAQPKKESYAPKSNIDDFF